MTARVIQGDCRQVMRTLPDACMDLVIADPPYGETGLAWDRWPEGWLAEIPRLLKPTGSMWVFGSLRMFMAWAGDFRPWLLAQEVVWEKHNGSNSLADRFRRVHESIAHFYPRGRLWRDIYKNPLYSTDAVAKSIRRVNKPQHWGKIGEHFYQSVAGGGRLLRSVWQCASEHKRAIHPTQKPLAILAPLIEYSCPRGGGDSRSLRRVRFYGDGGAGRRTGFVLDRVERGVCRYG